MKKTLHLNLIRKWFDMIKSGEKKEEYRDITPYWVKRLIYCIWSEYDISPPYENRLKNIDKFDDKITFENYNSITFSNGYAKDRDQFQIGLKGVSIGEGNPDWGAIPGKKYFVLELGKIL